MLGGIMRTVGRRIDFGDWRERIFVGGDLNGWRGIGRMNPVAGGYCT
jgi:hypothetical protein